METTARKTGARLALVFALPSLIPARASAQIRTATTTLAVRVERHGAIFLPADGEALARAARTGANASEPLRGGARQRESDSHYHRGNELHGSGLRVPRAGRRYGFRAVGVGVGERRDRLWPGVGVGCLTVCRGATSAFLPWCSRS